MLGRVPEWCQDWHGRLYYASSPANDPAGPLVGTNRVVRGGGQQVPDIRSASRHSDAPNKSLFGFRVVCEMSSLLLARAESAKPSASQEPRPQPAAGLYASQPKQLQERWAKALKTQPEITNSLGMQLVLIPPGEFMMGAANNDLTARPDQKPAHRVRITRPFYLGKCEVTRSQYNRVLPTEWPGPGRYDPSEGNLPVVRVHWSRAVRFCDTLSEHSVEKATGRVYRLPTEAEWEYACRLGTVPLSSGEARVSLEDYAWFGGTANSGPHPVGRKLPDALGLHDMFGNVWEFCADWYADDYYQKSPVDDPQGPEEASKGKLKIKVLRGGAYMRVANELCTGLEPSHRGGVDMFTRMDFIGFRVAVTLASIPDEAIAAAAKSISTGARVGDDAIGRQNPMGPPPGDGPFRPPLEDVGAAPAATNSVGGTTWVGKDSQGQYREFHFQKDGALHYRSGTSYSTNGTWKQNGNTIYMETNKKYAEFQGLIRGDRMEGNAWNVKGLRWTWTADKK
jgi:formylglycine-generating enzyme required for sulfatase activity